MGDFGAPIQDAAEQGSIEQQLSQPQEIISENDPRLVSEAIDVNTTGDAYAMPAPPPDGIYRAKLKVSQVTDNGVKKDYMVKMTKGKGGSAIVPYLSSALEATIITPGPYENLKVYDSWVSTSTGRDNSSKISTILGKLRKPDGSPYVPAGPAPRWPHKQWMDLYLQALSGEPEAGVETQWEWGCEECGKIAKEKGTEYPKSIVGMNKFPIDTTKSSSSKTGTIHIPELRCQVNPAHMFSKARPKIARVLSLDELAAELARKK